MVSKRRKLLYLLIYVLFIAYVVASRGIKIQIFFTYDLCIKAEVLQLITFFMLTSKIDRKLFYSTQHEVEIWKGCDKRCNQQDG